MDPISLLRKKGRKSCHFSLLELSWPSASKQVNDTRHHDDKSGGKEREDQDLMPEEEERKSESLNAWFAWGFFLTSSQNKDTNDSSFFPWLVLTLESPSKDFQTFSHERITVCYPIGNQSTSWPTFPCFFLLSFVAIDFSCLLLLLKMDHKTQEKLVLSRQWLLLWCRRWTQRHKLLLQIISRQTQWVSHTHSQCVSMNQNQFLMKKVVW